MKFDDQRIKHLELIQAVINRLSTNSFLLKGWTVVIVTALLSFSISEGSTTLAVFTLLPLLVFWGLDGFFLWEERKYRAHYERVRIGVDQPVDFSMKASDLPDIAGSWSRSVFSKTLVPFHGIILISIIAATLVETGAISWLSEHFSHSTTKMTTGVQHKSGISEILTAVGQPLTTTGKQ